MFLQQTILHLFFFLPLPPVGLCQGLLLCYFSFLLSLSRVQDRIRECKG
ncbi:hypothetical protein PORCRE_330 [Porphyromonas crevioricanis JCM 15906]|uniref:Uncharacterized protein n=1 Tax=Porphyromonas crevioricanis JCM 15906 TaxID=1305617 RepID=T1DQA9_9PORP|nr:hypothetical protein PORCRE_330 [Porphyromonas crevioricanis JCM 15906]